MNLQQENIKKCYDFLKEEKVVTSKDVALDWILGIGLDYDGNRESKDLMKLIDELMAYAKLGLEQIE
jgi:hypothetical protein